MEYINYEEFYNRVGAEIGWDFSQVKCVSEGVSWDFYDEVKKYCRKNHILLDIGTGGGESIREAFHRGQNYGQEDGIQKKTYIHQLREAGFKEITSLDYDAKDLIIAKK